MRFVVDGLGAIPAEEEEEDLSDGSEADPEDCCWLAACGGGRGGGGGPARPLLTLGRPGRVRLLCRRLELRCVDLGTI